MAPDPSVRSPRELMAKVIGTTDATPRQFRRKGLIGDDIPLVPEEMLDKSHKDKSEIADYYTATAGEYYEDDERGYRFTNLAGTIDPRTGEIIPGTPQAPSLAAESSTETQAAPMSIIPTSTINPDRPRTTAAGYDPRRHVITVMFRDGTFYNYYDITNMEWINFARAISKGRFILSYLDSKRRGAASVFGMPEKHRQALYKAARTSQHRAEGHQRIHTRSSKRRKKLVTGSRVVSKARKERYNKARREARAAAKRIY